MIRSFVPALLLLAFPGLSFAQGPFRTILSDPSSNSRSISARTILVNTPEELAEAWQATGRRDAPPVVDLRNHSLLFYFAGMRSTTGYSLEAEDVRHEGGVLTLVLRETVPGHLCGTLQTATFPLIIVETTPWKRDVDVQITEVEKDCSP